MISIKSDISPTWAARKFTQQELKLAPRQAAGANCCVVMEDIRFNIALT